MGGRSAAATLGMTNKTNKTTGSGLETNLMGTELKIKAWGGLREAVHQFGVFLQRVYSFISVSYLTAGARPRGLREDVHQFGMFLQGGEFYWQWAGVPPHISFHS